MELHDHNINTQINLSLLLENENWHIICKLSKFWLWKFNPKCTFSFFLSKAIILKDNLSVMYK